jgi:tetratricopeptide (TPR) repeat protein
MAKKQTVLKKKNRTPAPVQQQVLEPARPVGLFSLFLIGAVLISLMTASFARNKVYLTTISLWKNITETSPKKRRAHENLGQALSTEGHLQEALAQFNTVLALPDDGSVPLRDLYREIGVVQFRLGSMDGAIEAWQKGLQFADGDPGLLNNLSVAFMQQQRYDEAAASAEAALKNNPQMPQLLNTLGQVAMIKREYDKAVKCFLQAVNSDPDSPTYYSNAAMALAQTGRYEQALQNMNMAAARMPDLAQRQKAELFIEQMKKQLAIGGKNK